MFDLKTKIELSNARRSREFFDPQSITEVFLISVLLGEGENYYSALEEIKGHDVHIFTKEFTEIALNELDTISDFCAYLRAKEKFFRGKPRSIIVTGGEQILTICLREGRSFGEYEKADNIYLDRECLMVRILTEPKFINKKKADEISYGWDSIINNAHTGSTQYEIVAGLLARPNRFERRNLSKVFMEAHVKAHEDKIGDLFRRMMPGDGVTYCFLFADDFDEPREKRPTMLAAMCYLARGKFPQNKKVIGVATEKIFRPVSSYDFVFLDKPKWTEDQRKLSIFKKKLACL